MLITNGFKAWTSHVGLVVPMDSTQLWITNTFTSAYVGFGGVQNQSCLLIDVPCTREHKSIKSHWCWLPRPATRLQKYLKLLSNEVILVYSRVGVIDKYPSKLCNSSLVHSLWHPYVCIFFFSSLDQMNLRVAQWPALMIRIRPSHLFLMRPKSANRL